VTTTVTSLATRALTLTSYDHLSTSIGLVVIGVLAALLLVRDLWPMLRGSLAPRERLALDAAIVPLLMVLAIIVVARLADLLA
jgi:hypothetical protein